jgi:AmiR/NasT family two-component response regulator
MPLSGSAGAAAYLVKPLDDKTLLASVTSAVREGGGVKPRAKGINH